MNLPPLPILLVYLTLGALAATLFVRAVRDTIMFRRAGVGGAREYDMGRVASYFDWSGDAAAARLPARAWTDLDMDDVYRALDRTISWPGRHLLFARLRREDHDFAALRAFDDCVTRIADDDALRQRLRKALLPLGEPSAGALPALFQSELAPASALVRAIPFVSAANIVCFVAVFWWHPLISAIVGMVLFNAIVRVGMRNRIDVAVAGMRMLPALLGVARQLASLDVPALSPQWAVLRDAVPRLAWLARAARWLSFEPASRELAGYVYEYINLVFLLDVASYSWSVGAIRAEREVIRRAYEAIGALDVMQSVATLRGEARPWTRPVFISESRRSFAFAGLTHPVLDEPVPSALDLRGSSMLLTGSNMSGKSTFIRSVGVNAILARTIHTVFAERWRAPLLAARTSIGRADSLLQGTSYYRAEVDAVGALLSSAPGVSRLILIDELFRGTNSVERVAAAKAVLVYLDRGDDLIIVATHDLELIPMLPAYAQFHFREEVIDGALTFDYRLHPGPSSTRNALAILTLAGYPAEVVADATRTAEAVERRLGK